MREIKVRAWSNEHHRYCDFVTLDETRRWIGWIKTSGVLLTTTDIVLEQDTGLKDKYGKEIWEGDIVSTYNGDIIGKISQHKSGEWRIEWIGKFGGVSKLYDHRDLCEVVGNIHENNELLERKK